MIDSLDFFIYNLVHHTFSNLLFNAILPICRNKLTWIPLYISIAYYLYRQFQMGSIKIIVETLVLVGLSDIICAHILKPIFHRVRPCHLYKLQEWYRDFGLCSDTFSFPSCHATNHMAIAVFLSFYFKEKAYKYLLLLWAILIGYSQVYVGIHYPSDIIGGFLIGTLLAICMRRMDKILFSTRQSHL